MNAQGASRRRGDVREDLVGTLAKSEPKAAVCACLSQVQINSICISYQTKSRIRVPETWSGVLTVI